MNGGVWVYNNKKCETILNEWCCAGFMNVACGRMNIAWAPR